VTVEERLRATTEAVTEAMRPVRPLDLRPEAVNAQAPAKRRLPRHSRRWPGWLIPLAAAMAVIAVAATLVAVRSLSAAGPAARPTPAATSTVTLPNGVPRYYVSLTDFGTSSNGSPMRNAFLGDAKTGKQLATFLPPSDAVFAATASSSDGRTFVLDAAVAADLGPGATSRDESSPTTQRWYVLRLTPGATQHPLLTRVPIASPYTDTAIFGLAVSPDGQTLAILSHADATSKSPPGLITLRTYSLATGQLLRTWTAPGSSSAQAAFTGMSWLDDGRTVAFTYPPVAKHQDIRTLDTTIPGTNLIAGSHPVFPLPTFTTCYYGLLTADGKAVICGTFDANCSGRRPELTVYSVATGKLERVLYRYQGTCVFATAMVGWAKSATLAIGLIEISKPDKHPLPAPNMMGVVTPGKFTMLSVAPKAITYDSPGEIAF
jgi:hypothetical protein